MSTSHVLLAIVVLAIAASTFVALDQLRKYEVDRSLSHLVRVNQKVSVDLHHQLNETILDGKLLLQEADVAHPIETILAGDMSAAAQFRLRRAVARELFGRHYKGYYLIDGAFRVVASMKDSDLGTVIPEAVRDAIVRIERGEQGVITRPFVFHKQKQMWLLVPVLSGGHAAGSWLALVLGDQSSFSAVTLTTGVAFSSMETYLVDATGMMLSRSRFLPALVDAGLLNPGQSSTLNIRVADPGYALDAAHPPPGNVHVLPLTYAMQQVLVNHKSDSTTECYRNYLGQMVIGTWQWDKSLDAAIVSEFNADEALGGYYFVRKVVLALLLVIVAGGLMFSIAFARLRARSERESNRHRNLLLESTAEAIYGLDRDGKCSFVNRAFQEMLGFSETEVLGRNMHPLIHHSRPDGSPLPEEDCVLYRALRERTRIHARDECLWSKAGKPVFVEFWAQPMWEGDEVVGSVVTFLDIGEQLKVENEREQLEKQVQHTQRLESLGVLAGGIAHDFNNLLSAILGNASLVETTMMKDPIRAKECNARIISSAERAGVLCKQMLAYSGKGQFILKAIDLSAAVEEMTHLLEVSIDKSVVIKYHLAPNLPLVMVDEAQVQQVIMNLVTNANEAIGGKSGVISLTTGMMQADARYLASCFGNRPKPGRYLYVEISDTGCGMDRQTIEKIFDPFFTTKTTGRGLGMSAVIGIVRGHKGAMKIYSEPGRGTTFKFLLPVVEDTSPACSVEEGDEVNEQFSGGTVLVVDDEDTVRETAGVLLESMGFSVLTAANGMEALQVFRKQRGKVVLVLTDLTMPHMDGRELFSALRAEDPECRIILSSGYNSHDAIEQFSGRGLTSFIQKPYTRKALAREIRKVLGDEA